MTRAMLQIYKHGIWVATYYKNSDGTPTNFILGFMHNLYSFSDEPTAKDACEVANTSMVKQSGDHDSELSSVCDYVYRLDFYIGKLVVTILDVD